MPRKKPVEETKPVEEVKSKVSGKGSVTKKSVGKETKTVSTRTKKTLSEKSNGLKDSVEPSEVVDEKFVEKTDDGESVEVYVTSSDSVVSEQLPDTVENYTDDQSALDSFNSLPPENQKLYEKLMEDSLRPDQFVPSGSFVLDAVLSNGRGIPMGTFIEITSPAGVGKCVSGDTIVCVDGVYQRIDEHIHNTGYTEFVGNITTAHGTSKTSHKYMEKVSRVVEIEDQYGMTIRATSEHPLMVLRNFQRVWVKCGDLHVGDVVLGKGMVPFRIMPEDGDIAFYLHGIVQAQSCCGSCSQDLRSLEVPESLSVRVDKVLSDLGMQEYSGNVALEDLEDKEYRYAKLRMESGEDSRVTYQFPENVSHTFLKVDFDEPATTAQLLFKIAGAIEVCSYSRGCIPFVSVTMACTDFAKVLQRYLSMFGVVCTRQDRNLVFNRSNSACLRELVKRIAFNEDDCYVEDCLDNAVCDIGVTNSMFMELEKKASTPEASFLLTKVMRDGVSVRDLYELYLEKVLDYDFSIHTLHRVCTVRDIYETCFVYDYTIPDTHEFLANGLVSHNTSMLLFTAKNLCKQGYRCAYIDTEHGLNDNQLESFGLMPYVRNKLFIPARQLDTFEEIDEVLVTALNDPTLKFIFIDSLTAASPQSMVDKTSGESQTMAIHARTTATFLRRFRSLFKGTDKTVFFIAQNRKQFTMFGAQDGAAGGEAQKHYMDIIIKLTMKTRLKKRVKGYSEDIPYGSECTIKAEKNRFCAPGVPLILTIHFGRGVSNASALLTALESNDKIRQKGSFYIIEDVDGSERQIRGRDNVRAYISQNHAYYTDLVERLGGIRLVKSGNSIASSTEG